MKQTILEQRKLVANFFSNIGVAWFASGVIGIFVNRFTDKNNILVSLIWGIGYGFLFLYMGVYVLKSRAKRK